MNTNVAKGIVVIGLFALAFVLGAATVDSEGAYADTGTPQSCLDALDDAETGFMYAGQAIQAAETGFRAVAEYRDSELESALTKLVSANDGLSDVVDSWTANKQECRLSVE